MMVGFIGFLIYLFLVMSWLVCIYICLTNHGFTKRLLSLSMSQVPLFLFYIALSYIENSVAPIVLQGDKSVVFSNPLPHVLILTAIVVSLATLSLGLVFCIQIMKHDSRLKVIQP